MQLIIVQTRTHTHTSHTYISQAANRVQTRTPSLSPSHDNIDTPHTTNSVSISREFPRSVEKAREIPRSVEKLDLVPHMSLDMSRVPPRDLSTSRAAHVQGPGTPRDQFRDILGVSTPRDMLRDAPPRDPFRVPGEMPYFYKKGASSGSESYNNNNNNNNNRGGSNSVRYSSDTLGVYSGSESKNNRNITGTNLRYRGDVFGRSPTQIQRTIVETKMLGESSPKSLHGIGVGGSYVRSSRQRVERAPGAYM
jgi:hypothetical protein